MARFYALRIDDNERCAELFQARLRRIGLRLDHCVAR